MAALKRIRLVAPWGGRRAGAVLEVDPLRAARLVADGLAEAHTSTAARPDGSGRGRSTAARRRRGRSEKGESV